MALRDMRRADYGWGCEIQTRWADGDPYGHVNNIVYLSWFDTTVTRMLYERGVLAEGSSIGLCVESHCEYFAPVTFPETVEGRVRIGRMGEKSLRYEVGLFLDGRDEPAAAGWFVHVFVDRAARTPAALSERQRAAVADLVRT
jgi:acyl-CoA thioester hydrolase